MKKLYIAIIVLILGSTALTAQTSSHYYSCDFEKAEDRARWVLTPTASESIDKKIVNRWYIGNLGNNTIGGSNGLFISNDGGNSLEYSDVPCWSMAYDIVTLDALTNASYTLTFEYRAMGNVMDSDGVFVMWAPLTDPETGNPVKVLSIPTSDKKLPSEYENYFLRLQPGANLDYVNGTMTWKQCSVTIPKKQCNGEPHYLVFVWRNGAAPVHLPGAAIDNIEITDERPCDAPTNLVVTCADGAYTMTWKGDATEYEVSAYSYEEDKWYGPVDVQGKTYSFAGLPMSQTDFVVRAKCADNQYSLKTMLSQLVYYPDQMCVDYLNLDKAKCYTGTGFNNTTSFNSYVLGKVDQGYMMPESRHTVHFDRTETEQRSGGLLKTIPDGELASVRLGNWLNGNETERIEYSFMVDTLNYPVLLLKYAPLLEAPTHQDHENPRFMLDIMVGGVTIGRCGQADFNANNVLQGTGSNRTLKPEAAAQGWHLTPADIAQSPGRADVIWKDWTTVGVNLKDPAYEGKKLTVRLTTFDCAFTAHCGYAYFTLGCSDGKLKDMQCGAINPKFTAPDGFVYRWFYASDEVHRDTADGHMPEQYVRGHEQVFEAGYHDDHLYGVDCMFVQDSACYFTLYASTLATNPIPVINYQRTGMDCDNKTYTYHFDASKSYVEEIDHVTGDTTMSKRHKIEFFEWEFEKGKVDYSQKADYVFKAYDDRDTTYKVTLTTRFMTCERTDTISIFMPRITNYVDTTHAYLCDEDIKSGKGYKWHGKTYVNYTFDSIFIPSMSSCDTILYLDLKEPKRDTVNKLIFDYETYNFHGTEYNQTGTYYYASPECDTASVLNLYIYETLKAHLLDSVYTICAGEDNVALNYEITKGTCFKYSNRFKDNEKIAPIVRDNLPTSTGKGSVVIPIPTDLYPNRYEGWLTLHDTLPEQDVELAYVLVVNYPVSVLTQRWNDVLAVKNKEYNGGYTFSVFQWYKNGEPIEGATGSYLYLPQGLDFTASYSAELTRLSDHVKLFTCAITPEKMPEAIKDMPTLVPRNAELPVEGQGVARWYNPLGLCVFEQPYDDSPIMTPNSSGSFILQLDTKSYHIVVW